MDRIDALNTLLNASSTSSLCAGDDDIDESHSGHNTIEDDGQRHVHFSVVEEFEYEKPDFSPEEIADLWYTMEEMVGLVKYELKICEENNKKEGRCWRGLEHMKGGTDNRAERVTAITDGILDAYDELSYDSDQFKSDADKEEALRSECRALTRDDRKRAYKFGLRDATVAEGIIKEGKEAEAAAAKKGDGRGSRTTSKSSTKSRSGRKSSPRDKRRVKRTRSRHSPEDSQRKRSHSPTRELRGDPATAIAPPLPMEQPNAVAVGA